MSLCPISFKKLNSHFFAKALIYQIYLIQRHVIPKKFSFAKFQQSSSQTRFCQDEFLRSGNCPLLLSGKNQCSSCLAHGANFIHESKRKEVRLKEPAKLTAPVSFTSPDRLKLTLQQHCLKCKQLEQQINEMRQSLEKSKAMTAKK